MRSGTQYFGPAPGLGLVQPVWVKNSVLSAAGGLVTPAWSWVSSASEHHTVQGLARSRLHLCPGTVLSGPGPSL